MISRMDIPPTRRVAIDAPVTGLAFSRDGRTLGIAGGDGRVHALATDTLQGTAAAAHGGAALSLIADPAGDGDWRFTACVDLVAARADGVPTLHLVSIGRLGEEVTARPIE